MEQENPSKYSEFKEDLQHAYIDEVLGETLNNGGEIPAGTTLTQVEKQLLTAAVVVLAPNIDDTITPPKLRSSLNTFKKETAEHLDSGETITGIVVAAAIISAPRRSGGIIGKMTAPVNRLVDESILGGPSKNDVALHRACQNIIANTYGREARRNIELEHSSSAPLLWARAAELAIRQPDSPIAEAILNSFKASWDEHRKGGGYPQALIDLSLAITRARVNTQRLLITPHRRAIEVVGGPPLTSPEEREQEIEHALASDDPNDAIRLSLRLINLSDTGDESAKEAVQDLWDGSATDVLVYLHEQLDAISKGEMDLDALDYITHIDPGGIEDDYLRGLAMDIRLALDTALRKAKVRKALRKHIEDEARRLQSASQQFHRLDARASLSHLADVYADRMQREREERAKARHQAKMKEYDTEEEIIRIRVHQSKASQQYNGRLLEPMTNLADIARKAMERGDNETLLQACISLRERVLATPEATRPVMRGIWNQLWAQAAPRLLDAIHARRAEIAKGVVSPEEVLFALEILPEIGQNAANQKIEDLYDAVRKAAYRHHGLPERIKSHTPRGEELHHHWTKLSEGDNRAIILSFADDLLMIGEEQRWATTKPELVDDIIRMRAARLEYALRFTDQRRLPRRIAHKSTELIYATAEQRHPSWWRALRERWRIFQFPVEFSEN